MEPQCNLIVDSCCELPVDMIDREGVTLLEFPFFFGTEEHFDDLWRSMTPHEFYERMRKGEQPSTAQLSIASLTNAFLAAAESGVPTVYLSFTSGLSGSIDMAIMVRDQVMQSHPSAELYAVDTLMASTAEAFLVSEAIRQRDKGMSAQELVAWVEEARYFVNAIFMVDDLESLRRGGRIPDSIAYAGSKLDVKPLLNFALDGTLAMKGVARGRKKAIRQMADFYTANADADAPSHLLAVGNADNARDMEKLKEAILKDHDDVVFMDSVVGPVIGCHVGPGMFSLVFWGSDRRESVSVADRIARRIRRAE